MRRLATSLVLVVLASLIFYGGAGVNFVSYCCGTCEEEGLDALLESKCCEIHNHDHDSEAIIDNVASCSSMCGCDIERIAFDWNSVNVYLPDLQPVVHDLFFFDCIDRFQALFSFMDKYTSIQVTGPPVACPRTYLSLLTTLLI